MNSMSKWAASVLGLLVATAASAHNISDKGLDAKAAASDLVAIVKVVEVDRKAGVATVDLLSIIKGSNDGSSVRFRYRVWAFEQRVECCQRGELYLLFLSRAKDGYYESVNGRYGVFKIDGRKRMSPNSNKPDQSGQSH